MTETLSVAKMAAPGLMVEGVQYVAAPSIETWLLACAAGSGPISADVCRALADAVSKWKPQT